MDNRDNQLKVMAKDVHYNDVKKYTHEDMEHNFLRGDAIDETTRGSVDDYEIDRQPASREDGGPDSLVNLPKHISIQNESGNDGMVQNAAVDARPSHGRRLSDQKGDTTLFK